MGVPPLTDLYSGHGRRNARPSSSSSMSVSIILSGSRGVDCLRALAVTLNELRGRESSLGHPNKDQGEARCSDSCQA